MEKHFMQKTAATSLSQYFKSSYLQENLCLHVCFASNKRKPSYVFLEVHALNDIFKNVSNFISSKKWEFLFYQFSKNFITVHIIHFMQGFAYWVDAKHWK